MTRDVSRLLWKSEKNKWARSSVVYKALNYKPEGRGFETRWGECIFFNLPNPPTRTRPRSSLSLHHKWVPEAEKECFWEVERGWCVGLRTTPPSVSRLSRQCGILNISLRYRLPRPVTWIVLLFFLLKMRNLRSNRGEICWISPWWVASPVMWWRVVC
jgi:hypothetical protein